MQHFPIFISLTGKRVVLSGGGDAAVAKLRLLLKTSAHIAVFSENPVPKVMDWATEGQITLNQRSVTPSDIDGASLFYAADEDETRDAQTAEMARSKGVPVNIVDNLHGSDFITPAIVDRNPVTIAIGTEGAAPVLARAIKADLEERLHPSLGALAKIGKLFRPAADQLPMGRRRRAFWESYYLDRGPKAYGPDGETGAKQALTALLAQHLKEENPKGHVDFVGAGPGDPELLTLKARKALDAADVVIYDRLVSSDILELARREAILIDVGKTGFAPSTAQVHINETLVAHAGAGHKVVRLKSGDPTVFGRLDEELDAIQGCDVTWQIIPGITAASAAVAAIGQSLTQRQRNSAVRIITGHDTHGYAEHDWQALASIGQVTAIYMGKKSARFIQGRLLMHGAAADTPVTTLENVSRSNQRIVSSTVSTMAQDLADARLQGPALTFIGLSPRDAIAVADELQPKEYAL